MPGQSTTTAMTIPVVMRMIALRSRIVESCLLVTLYGALAGGLA